MLKINLVPTKRETARAGPDNGRLFALAMGASVVLVSAGLLLFHSAKVREVTRATAANDAIESQTSVTRARVADGPKVREEIAQLRAREQAITRLEVARTGPTSMLVELSHILSPGGRPAADPALVDRIQRESPSEMFNPTWNSHRLWLVKLVEQDRMVEIEGSGRTADDIGEFMRRMMLSQYFNQVRLDKSQAGEDAATKVVVQQFKLTARARY